ncbi:MAG TPA: hypothetical protein VMV12_07690 [Candidatus Micrarchaeaceae archaeon]|nr:hypothetical protein [Candidatus Micrarchaeaceae archaeon]
MGGGFLEDALRIAHIQLVTWMSNATGRSFIYDYQLLSPAMGPRIANAVDANYTILAKVPRRFLPRDFPWIEGTHDRVQERGRAAQSLQLSPGDSTWSLVGLWGDQVLAFEDAPDGGHEGNVVECHGKVAGNGGRSGVLASLLKFPAQLEDGGSEPRVDLVRTRPRATGPAA